jgi:hypothetical protein
LIDTIDHVNSLAFVRDQSVHGVTATNHGNTTMNANATIPEPRNRETGFYGSMYEYAQQTWPLAVRAVAAATEGSFENARVFLEGGSGRRFAEAVYLTISADVDTE